MASQTTILTNRLYAPGGLGATNVHISPGSSRDVTSEQVATEMNRALSRIEDGDVEDVDTSEE